MNVSYGSIATRTDFDNTTMDLTELERDLVVRLVAGDPDEAIFLQQLAVASVRERNREGMALYIWFDFPERAPTLSTRAELSLRSNKFVLVHPDVEAACMAVLEISGGRLSYLDCYTMACDDWPVNSSGLKILTVKPIETATGWFIPAEQFSRDKWVETEK